MIITFQGSDRTFIEMASGSHLPVQHPDNENDILHETQLLLMNSNSQLSSQLDDLNVVAYVSGKKSLFKVLMKLKKFYSQDNLTDLSFKDSCTS